MLFNNKEIISTGTQDMLTYIMLTSPHNWIDSFKNESKWHHSAITANSS